MTLTQLKYAITVSEAGSMNQAAKELFISQPSLSLAIRDLEEEIGVIVFLFSFFLLYPNQHVLHP